MQPADPSSPQHVHYDPNPRHHPGLRAIALIEGIKGILALLAASGLEVIGPIPLKRWVHALIDEFQLDPDHGALAWLSHTISPGSVHMAAAGGHRLARDDGLRSKQYRSPAATAVGDAKPTGLKARGAPTRDGRPGPAQSEVATPGWRQ